MGCLPCIVPDDPSLASTSRFLEPRWFMVYKFLLASYFLFWCVWWPVGEDIYDGYKFLTYWTFYTAALYFVISTMTAYTTSASKWSDNPEGEPGTMQGRDQVSALYRCILWVQIVTWNVSCISSFVVVTVFWGVLYNGHPLNSVDINAHILIAIIMVVDVILVATEYKFKHLLASEVYGLLYVAFNVSFFCLAPQDQRVLYSILDWGKNAGAAAGTSIFLMVVFVPVSSLLFYAIFTLRERIFRSCTKHLSGASADELELGYGRGTAAGVPGTATQHV